MNITEIDFYNRTSFEKEFCIFLKLAQTYQIGNQRGTIAGLDMNFVIINHGHQGEKSWTWAELRDAIHASGIERLKN